MQDESAIEADGSRWVRCPGCRNGLWRLFATHLEMTIRVRGGQYRTISAPLDSTTGLTVQCEKCGGSWSSSGSSEIPLRADVAPQ